MFQFISDDYQTEVEEKVVKDIMVDVAHQKLIPALFHLIWTKIRNQSSGDSVDMPNWPLKVGMTFLWIFFFVLINIFKETLEASEEEHCPEVKEDFYKKIPASLQVKHAVSLFIKVNARVTRASDA